jgi:hypothetical protein
VFVFAALAAPPSLCRFCCFPLGVLAECLSAVACSVLRCLDAASAPTPHPPLQPGPALSFRAHVLTLTGSGCRLRGDLLQRLRA